MFDILQDQYLVAGFALFAFSIFALGAYIVHEERKSRIHVEQPPVGPDTIEKRVRRAF